MTEVYEKLILGHLWHLWHLADSNKVDLTGENQHGFKKERSIVSAALQLQSQISRALDVLSSLDLSSAFDIVNLQKDGNFWHAR